MDHLTLCVFCCQDAAVQGPVILSERIRTNLLSQASARMVNVDFRLRRVCENCWRMFFYGYSYEEIRSYHLSTCSFCRSVTREVSA